MRKSETSCLSEVINRSLDVQCPAGCCPLDSSVSSKLMVLSMSSSKDEHDVVLWTGEQVGPCLLNLVQRADCSSDAVQTPVRDV